MVSTPGKEQHALYQQLPSPWSEEAAATYRQLFPADQLSGEFTPFYMRAPASVAVAADVLRPDGQIFVLLRDPIERYESSMRLGISRGALGKDGAQAARGVVRTMSSEAVWAGMYAAQIDLWERTFGRERILVIQYEAMRADPGRHVAEAWRRLGLEPVALKNVDQPSRTAVADVLWTVDDVPGLRTTLRRLYETQLPALETWGIDPALWKNFT